MCSKIAFTEKHPAENLKHLAGLFGASTVDEHLTPQGRERTGLSLPCPGWMCCRQGCYQKVNVSVPPASILRVPSLFSERDKSYCFQEQLPDWVPAVGRQHPAAQSAVSGRRDERVSPGLEPFRGVVLGSCLQRLWLQPALGQRALTDLDTVLIESPRTVHGGSRLRLQMSASHLRSALSPPPKRAAVRQHIPLKAPSVGQEVSESCSYRGGSRGMSLFLPCFQYFDVMWSVLPVAVFWEQIGKLWLVASAWQLTSHTVQRLQRSAGAKAEQWFIRSNKSSTPTVY